MTDYLYGRPSYLTGMARTLDLFGLFDNYNFSATPLEADRRALLSDWNAIGRDLHGVMVVRKHELKEQGQMPPGKRNRAAFRREMRKLQRSER